MQIDLSDDVRDVLCEIQKELNELEPDNLFLLPRQYQHISFNQVVFWGGQYALGTKKAWDMTADNFLSAYNKLNNIYPSFEITFSKLIATAGGIIWTAADEEDAMESLRSKFQNNLPIPIETTKLNHIVHTTLALYKNKLNSPQKVFDYLEKHDKSASMKVKKIVLRKELVFPSIETEELASINLL